MNPYCSPSQSTSKRRDSITLLVVSALIALFGFIVASPGLVYITSDMGSPVVSGRRYATYDPELYLFGILLTPTTAQVLTFGVAPFLIALSAFLVVRVVKHGRIHKGSGSHED